MELTQAGRQASGGTDATVGIRKLASSTKNVTLVIGEAIMKTICISALLIFSLLGDAFSGETNALPTKITIGTETYEEVIWDTVTPATVSIHHKTGIVKIQLANLPPELQQHFGYDPTKAAAWRAQELAAQEKTRAAEAKRRLQRQGQSTDIEKLKGSVEYLDACNGFKDLKFGTDISECQGMEFDGAKEFGVTYYLRTGDFYKIGDAMLLRINYEFYKGKFSCVSFGAAPGLNSRHLLAVLQQAYGRGTPNGEGQILWLGQKVGAIYTLDDHDYSDVSIFSKPIAIQKKSDEQTRDKEAAKGL